MHSRTRPLVFAALLLVAVAPAAKASELGAAPAPVPATLDGGTVVHAAAVKALLSQPGIVVLDVSEVPHRPAGLAQDARWMPPQHRDIPGSVWIPGVGRKAISEKLEAYYRSRLAELTGAAPDRDILIYCHPNCWGSWNAARRALGYGYRNVFWYPDGIEGWQDAGYFTIPAEPQGPDAQSGGNSEARTTN